LVHIHEHEHRVFVIKFHDKNHANSPNKYNFVLNDFDQGKVLRTVFNICLDEILANEEIASFAFVGAHKHEKELKETPRSERYRVYRRMIQYFMGNETFVHTYQ
jgi:hypothetical protein